MKKFIFLVITLSMFLFINIDINAQYGTHLTEPFEMNHHITTYMDTNNGYLYVTGANNAGQLGDGTTKQSNYYFAVYKSGVQTDKFINPIDWDFEIYHSAIIDADGSLWTAGQNGHGMLGSSGGTRSTFERVQLPNDLKATKVIASRGYCTLVLLEDGNLYGVGHSSTVGVTNDTSFVQMNHLLPEGDQDVVEFQGGEYCTMLLTSKGNLYTIGSTTNVMGGASSFTIPKLTNVIQIDLMYKSSYALKNDGTIWCTGENGYGQFGFSGTTSTFKQSVLTLEDNEFVTLIKGGIGTGYLLTNKGNVYIAGRNDHGQFGDGTKTNNSTFTKKHESVAFIDVGEYQAGILFKDSTLKFFGYNEYGQLGIGTTTDVIDVNAKEADLIAPADDGLGSGLTPAVSLPNYEPDISIWPSEELDKLTDEEIEESTVVTKPIQPGEAFDDGSSNTFVDDYGNVYNLSIPAMKSSIELTNEIEFNSNDFLKVYYQNIDFSSGVLKDYKLKITIEGTKTDYRNSFFYGTDQELESNYPKAVDTYTVTSTLLNTRYETKTTNVSKFEIKTSAYKASDNNIQSYLNDIQIISGTNTVDRLKEDITNGIKYSNYLEGEFTDVEGITRQYYVDGDFSNLDSSNISISFGTSKTSSSLSNITTSGTYYCRVNVCPDNYTSETLYFEFIVDAEITPESEFTHNTPIVKNVNFNEEYTIDINNTVISSDQTLYISFVNSSGKVVSSFEATEENLSNYSLYPKSCDTYKVVSTIKNSEGVTLSIKYSNDYKISALSKEYIFDAQGLIDESVESLVANGTTRIDDKIRENINLYLKDYLTLNDVYIVIGNELVLLTDDNFKNYLEISFYTSAGYDINEINSNGMYYVSFNLNIPNYTLEEDTTKYSFNINQVIELTDDCVTINNSKEVEFSIAYDLEINSNSIEIFDKDIYELIVVISNSSFNYSYVYGECDSNLLPKEVGEYQVIVKTKLVSSNIYLEDVYTTIAIVKASLNLYNTNLTEVCVKNQLEMTDYIESLIEAKKIYLSKDLYQISNNSFVLVKLDISLFELTFYNRDLIETEVLENGDYCVGIRFIGFDNYNGNETIYLNFTIGEIINFENNCVYFILDGVKTNSFTFSDFTEDSTLIVHLDGEENFYDSKYNVVLTIVNSNSSVTYKINYIQNGVVISNSVLNETISKIPGYYNVTVQVTDDTNRNYPSIYSSLEIKKGSVSLNGIEEEIIKDTLSNIYTSSIDLKSDISTKLDSLISTTIKTDQNTYIVNSNKIELSSIVNFSYIFSPNDVKDIGVYTVEIYFEENSYYKEVYSIPFEFEIIGYKIKNDTASFVYGNNFEISTTIFEFSKFNENEYLIDLGEEFDKYLNDNYEVTVYITNEYSFSSVIEDYVAPNKGGNFYNKMPYESGVYTVTIKVKDNLSHTYFEDSISYLTIDTVKAVISNETKDSEYYLEDNLYDSIIETYLNTTKLLVNNIELNNFVIYNNGFDTKEITYEITICDEYNNEVNSLEEGTYTIVISTSCENYKIDSIQYEVIIISQTSNIPVFVIASIIFIVVVVAGIVVIKARKNY